MKVLVINCGSSSLKYQLLDMQTEKVLAKGYCQKVGIEGSFSDHEANGVKTHSHRQLKDHKQALKLMSKFLTDKKIGVIFNINEIDAVGHRVVHGGENFSHSVIIDGKVKEAIRECIPLAPLHNPPNLMGIEACERIMPNTPMVAVFDTAFHQSMDKKSYLYAIPYEYYEKYGIRRYGFHGTSHKYVSNKVAEILDTKVDEIKVISCHIGNGASICAINKGKVQDTSMGLTPLEGLVMGTRCGDIDPAIIKFLSDKEGYNIHKIDDILNKNSGLLGVSGISNDIRDIEQAESEGNQRAKLALEMFAYRVAKYIGAYAAAMNGVDVVLFTAGVGENGIKVREEVCAYLGYLGIYLDKEANDSRGKLKEITTSDSKVKVFVVPTDEELMIARETKGLIG
ncbi:MAG: acetate kinase [Clostridiales bacterium GWE2_32_10]|nr:MAG: acetate kinase [Clostridiales bacterium GWE2_32_10]HBY20978.1 acetate kinase [Clostridiales bacterium]